MFEWLSDPNAWIALGTLTLLEIVLGVDNIIFISILVGRLPEQQRNRARNIGLMLAMGSRLALLASLAWIMKLKDPLFTLGGFSLAGVGLDGVHVPGTDISGRDLILIGGGLFLLWKSVHEIHGALEGAEDEHAGGRAATYGSVLAQIAVVDIIFSLDSVITAVGLADHLGVMVAAIVIAVLVMLFAARPIGEFVDRHPTVKMLALAFLILVGFTLVIEGFDVHVPKGYVYFAMAFSVGVEMLNLRLRARAGKPVKLHKGLPQ